MKFQGKVKTVFSVPFKSHVPRGKDNTEDLLTVTFADVQKVRRQEQDSKKP